MSLVEGKKLRWCDCINVILKHGKQNDQNDLFKLTNVFQVARLYGGTTKDEFVCMLGYVIGSIRGLVRPFAEGWYLLTEKGQRERGHRCLAGVENE